MKPSDQGLMRIIKASGYSWRGFRWVWCHEAAFRQEVYAAVVMLPIALLVDVSVVESVILVASLALVFIVELLNSAIEAAIDRIGPEKHELSGAAKDMGSSAVLVALCLVIFVWVKILILR